ncbi:MAG: c-type cytochrome biogenesis protein CcmI [Parvibaculum sp.]
MPITLLEIALWLIAGGLTACVVAYLLRALRAGPSTRQNPDIDVYKDQLNEIDRDLERGVMAATDAESARLEISRRLIAAADHEGQCDREAGVPTRAVATALAIVVPVVALGGYLLLGSPGLPAQPYFERLNVPLEELPIEGLVARLESRLEDEPDDARGWRLIGPVYMQLGRYGEAINAFGRIMQIEGREADALAGLGEALTLSGDGMVPPPAIRAFEAALEMDEKHPRSRFYLALAKAQTGDLAGALADWKTLLSDTPEDAPWRTVVENHVAVTEERLAQPSTEPSTEPTTTGE